MKKFISVILAITLIVSAAVVFSACKNKEKDEKGDCTDMFAEATEELTGASFEEIADLGKNGECRVFLAAQTATVPDAPTTYAILKISDAGEKAEIVEIISSEAAVLTDPSEPISGGWAKCKDTTITDEAKNALEKACEMLAGATYKPVALLGTQVVAGTNYLIICEMTATIPGAKTDYALVTVYADLEGNAEITDVVEFVADSGESESAEEASEANTEENTESIANPVVEYKTYNEAAKAAGFDLDTPDLASVDYSVISGQIFQITSKDTYIRKAKGSDDISGDYTDYLETKSETVSGKDVTLKGKNGKINLITWADGGYSYCVGFKSGVSRTEADLYIQWVK